MMNNRYCDSENFRHKPLKVFSETDIRNMEAQGLMADITLAHPPTG